MLIVSTGNLIQDQLSRNLSQLLAQNMTQAPEVSRLFTPDFLRIWIANFFMTTCVGCFFLFPLFIKQRGGTEADIGILMGAVTISSILGKPWISQAIDSFGRKRSYVLGIVSFIFLPFVFLLFKGELASFYISVFLVRIFQGIGIALCFTSAFTLVADIIPQERLNEGLGMFGVTGLFGIATGPTISEPIIKYFGFDWYFICNALIAIGSFVLVIPLKDRYVPKKPSKDDVTFLDVLRKRKPLVVGILVVFFGISLATQNNYISPFVEKLGLPSISVFFIAYSLSAVLARVFGSKLADRVGEVKVIPWAFLLMACGFLFLVAVDNSFMLFVSGFIAGGGHGFLFPCLNALMIRNEPIHTRGKINGIFTGGIDVGIFIGSVGLGYIGEWFGYIPIFVSTFFVLILALLFFHSYIKKLVL